MIKAFIITVSIAVLFLCACGLLQEWKQARQRRRERVARKRYIKRFRKNQRECDAMFEERDRDRQEVKRRHEKWDKQNFMSHNPELEKYLGVIM